MNTDHPAHGVLCLLQSPRLSRGQGQWNAGTLISPLLLLSSQHGGIAGAFAFLDLQSSDSWCFGGLFVQQQHFF